MPEPPSHNGGFGRSRPLLQEDQVFQGKEAPHPVNAECGSLGETEASAGWNVTPASVETTSPLAVAAQIDGLTSGPLTAAAAWTVDRQP